MIRKILIVLGIGIAMSFSFLAGTQYSYVRQLLRARQPVVQTDAVSGSDTSQAGTSPNASGPPVPTLKGAFKRTSAADFEKAGLVETQAIAFAMDNNFSASRETAENLNALMEVTKATLPDYAGSRWNNASGDNGSWYMGSSIVFAFSNAEYIKKLISGDRELLDEIKRIVPELRASGHNVERLEKAIAQLEFNQKYSAEGFDKILKLYDQPIEEAMKSQSLQDYLTGSGLDDDGIARLAALLSAAEDRDVRPQDLRPVRIE